MEDHLCERLSYSARSEVDARVPTVEIVERSQDRSSQPRRKTLIPIQLSKNCRARVPDLAARCTRVLQIIGPKIRGRRESRVPVAPIAPCAKGSKHTVVDHRYAGNTRPSLRNGFNGFLRALPGDQALLSPSLVRCLLLTNLTPASGRQDHTTSPSASCAVRLRALLRPPHPAPNVRDDRETPLLEDTG